MIEVQRVRFFISFASSDGHCHGSGGRDVGRWAFKVGPTVRSARGGLCSYLVLGMFFAPGREGQRIVDIWDFLSLSRCIRPSQTH